MLSVLRVSVAVACVAFWVGCVVGDDGPPEPDDQGQVFSCRVRSRIIDSTQVESYVYDVCAHDRDGATDTSTTKCFAEHRAAYCDVTCDAKVDDAGAPDACVVVP